MISFIIITDGKKGKITDLSIKSIIRQNIHEYEIIIIGKSFKELDKYNILNNNINKVLFIPCPKFAENGNLGAMRNIGFESCKGDYAAVMDDDIILDPWWYHSLFNDFPRYDYKFDVCTSKVISPDGTRFWDNCTKGGPKGHIILDEDEEDDFKYMSGGCAWAISRKVFEKVKYDDKKGFYEEEDVDFSHRVKEAGFALEHEEEAIAFHYDHRYTRLGRVTIKDNNRFREQFIFAEQEANYLLELFLKIKDISQMITVLRVGMLLYPTDTRFKEEYDKLETRAGGNPGGDCWHLGGYPYFSNLITSLIIGEENE